MVASRVFWLKRNRTRLALGGVLCALLWWTAPLCAASDSGSLLVLDAGSPGHAPFLAALRIQLGNAYAVRELALDAPTAVSERVARATALVAAEQAVAAVWMEDSAGGQSMRTGVLYVVSRREGRALVEVVQVPSARGADLPRALSLKLGELLQELQAGVELLSLPAAAPNQPSTAVRATAVPQPPAAVEGPSEPTLSTGRFWAAGRVGARIDFGVGTSSGRGGLGAELTPEWREGRLRVGLGVGATWYPSLTNETSQGSVRLSEVSPRVLLSLAFQTSLFDVGVHTAGVLNLVSARGRTKAGRIGDSREEVWGWAFGIHAERNLWGPLGVVLFVEAQPQREHIDFQVNDETVLDRGRLRITWGLDLRLRTALSSTASKERGLTRSP